MEPWVKVIWEPAVELVRAPARVQESEKVKPEELATVILLNEVEPQVSDWADEPLNVMVPELWVKTPLVCVKAPPMLMVATGAVKVPEERVKVSETVKGE